MSCSRRSYPLLETGEVSSQETFRLSGPVHFSPRVSFTHAVMEKRSRDGLWCNSSPTVLAASIFYFPTKLAFHTILLYFVWTSLSRAVWPTWCFPTDRYQTLPLFLFSFLPLIYSVGIKQKKKSLLIRKKMQKNKYFLSFRVTNVRLYLLSFLFSITYLRFSLSQHFKNLKLSA